MRELLKAKNMVYAGEQSYLAVGGEVKLQTAVLVDLNAAQWNGLAEKTNARSFIRMTGQQPASYAEVQAWMKTLIEGTK